MKLTVSPREIADFLIEQKGHLEAENVSKSNYQTCIDKHTKGIWREVNSFIKGRGE